MAAKKPGAQSTVTLKHLAANLSESHELSKKQSEAILGDLVNLVTKHLKNGDRIRIGGGSDAEYRLVDTIMAANATHVSMSFPLSRGHAAGSRKYFCWHRHRKQTDRGFAPEWAQLPATGGHGAQRQLRLSERRPSRIAPRRFSSANPTSPIQWAWSPPRRPRSKPTRTWASS